ncbi:hypothetical protein H310_10450 [Aphanomyces invadans]|uniref:BAR domain-containing protein n=1 Tax=Aphanomyces invadans TaxID=157072 RepID=A0A024TSF0_9STRA|nr:hypothetical protein H310_10450 [Aphanomyces invadans]ETV96277.1 hypothetical protein H310_10450 [Aphanomyces invadans]|eukprot:XP_008875069.1 hypothetical protein H310_10450 [Aphanomyces invadans]
MQVKPTTASLAQNLWRKKRLLTQEVLQAIGRTQPSHDSKFKLALDNFVAYIGHVRVVAGRLDAHRVALLALHGTSTALDAVTAASSTNSTSHVRAEILDAALSRAVQSLEAKAKALEAHEDLIRARAAAKLEVDSLYRLKSPRVIAATKLLETLTDSLFREFAHVEAHRDQLIHDDLAAAHLAIQSFLATFSAPPPTSSTSRHALCEREDELLAEYLAPEAARPNGAMVPPPDDSITDGKNPHDGVEVGDDSAAWMVVPLSPTAPRRETMPRAKSAQWMTSLKRLSSHLKPRPCCPLELGQGGRGESNQVETLDMTASDSCVFGSHPSLLQLDMPLS